MTTMMRTLAPLRPAMPPTASPPPSPALAGRSRAARRTYHALARLDAAQLKDIGLTAGELLGVSRTIAEGRFSR